MTLDELKARYGVFASTDRRPRLFEKLSSLLNDARAVGFVKHVIVDGSFISSEPNPGDIDLIIAIDPGILDTPESWSARDQNMLSADRLRKKYAFDVWVAPEGSATYVKYHEWFQNVKYSDAKKGVVRLSLS